MYPLAAWVKIFTLPVADKDLESASQLNSELKATERGTVAAEQAQVRWLRESVKQGTEERYQNH